MDKTIPKYYETFDAILAELRTNDIYKRRHLIQTIIQNNYADLSPELLAEKIQSGGLLIDNRIGWGLSYLKNAGYIAYPQRGHVQITDKGTRQNTPLTLNQVKLEMSLLGEVENEPFQAEMSDNNFSILTQSPQDLIEHGVLQMKQETQNELLSKLKTLDPYYFEKVILILLSCSGFIAS